METNMKDVKRTVEVCHDGTVSEYVITDAVDLGEAEFVHFWCTELGDKVAAFLYPDGAVVTTDDWQWQQPEHITDVKDYNWMLCGPDGYEPCAFFGGLPRSVMLR